MTKSRRRFTAAEKSKIALTAIKGELTMAEISSKYSVHPTQINKWKKQALAKLPEAFSSKHKQVEQDHNTELSGLYEQIGRLKGKRQLTNPIESTFATVRHRTKKAKGCFSRTTILTMVFKLAQSAEKRWNRIRGFDQLNNVIKGIKFIDGIQEDQVKRKLDTNDRIAA